MAMHAKPRADYIPRHDVESQVEELPVILCMVQLETIRGDVIACWSCAIPEEMMPERNSTEDAWNLGGMIIRITRYPNVRIVK